VSRLSLIAALRGRQPIYSFPTFERQEVALELPQMSGVVRLHHGKRPGFKMR